MKKIFVFFQKHLAEIAFVFALLGIYLANSTIGEYNDEWDNILSGKMMADGLTLYRDIFSHHFPLPYVVSFIIHLFIDPNFFSFRILFSLLLFGWTLFLYGYTRTASLQFPRKYFFLLLALVSPALGMNMLLAEVLVGYSALTILCIVLYRPRPLSTRDYALLLFFAFCIAASAMAYLPLALFTYFFVLITLFRNRSFHPWRRILFLAAFAFLPYALSAITLLVTGSLQDFLWQNVTFNQNYYLTFLYDYPQGVLAFPLFIVKNLSKAMISSFNISLAHVENIVYLALLLAPITYLLHLFRRRSYLVFAFFLGVFVLSSARLATEGGIAHQGNVPFYMVSLVAFALMSARVFDEFRFHFENFSKNWMAAIGTTVIFFFFAYTGSKVIDSYYSLTFAERRIENGSRAADLLNDRLKPGETYWVGPYDFKTQYYVRSPLATRYTFYLPWHARSAKITDDLIESFKTQKPSIIIFDSSQDIWGHKAVEFGKPILEYLANEYTRADDPELNNFYFRRNVD